MAGVALLLVLAAAPRVAAQDRAATPDAGAALSVRYRSATSVYLDGGRAAGLRVGERLRVVSEGQAVGELEVVFLAEHSASCRLIRESRPVRAGDRIVRFQQPAAPPPPAPDAAAASHRMESPSPASTPPSAPPTTPPAPRVRPWARTHGSASLVWSRLWETTPSTRGFEERTARLDLTLASVGGGPYSLRVRGRSREDLRFGERSPLLPRPERQDRLYEMAFSYEPPDGRLSVHAGRIGAAPFVGVGYLDGGLAQLRVGPQLELGGFLGRTAEPALGGGLVRGPKYGAFARLSPGGPARYDVLLAGVRETADGDVAREYAALETRVRSGRFWLHERMEVDFYRGGRRELAGRSTQVSDLAVGAAWRHSAQTYVSLSYDRRRNKQVLQTRSEVPAIVDDVLRQGLQLRLQHGLRGGLAAWAGAGLRLQEGDRRESWSVSGGVRHPRLLGVGFDLDGSLFTNPYGRGHLLSARLARSLAAGHHLSASFTRSLQVVDLTAERRASHWLRISAYGELGRGLFATADVDHGFGSDFRGLRAGAELGYRF